MNPHCVSIENYIGKRNKFQETKQKPTKYRKKARTTLTPNAIFQKFSMDVLHALHARRVYTVNYKGEFQNQANGLIVRRAPTPKYAAWQQK